jgi:hypothetical protein
MQLPPLPLPSLPFYRNKYYLLAGLLLLGSLGLLVWLDIFYIMPIKRLDVPNPDNDLSVFWSGARTVWQGGNPYEFSPGSLFHRIANAAGGDSDIFLSPFFLTLLFMPLAALPLNLAALVWLIFSQFALGVSVYLLLKLAGQRVTPPVLLQATLLVVFWRYSFEVMILNNLSLLMLGAAVLSYYCSRTGRPFRAGAVAALLLLKPQIVFLILPLLLVVPTTGEGELKASWLNRATYRRWLGFGAGCLVFGVYSFGVYPGWVGEWLKAAGGRYTPQFDSEMASVRSVAALVVGDQLVTPVYGLLAAVICLAALVIWWRNRYNVRDFSFVLALVCGLNLLAAPYTRSYDFCLLLIPLLYSFFKLRQLEKADRKTGRQKFHWSLLWWALLILVWPLHLLTITTTFAWENLVTLALIGAVAFTWRRYSKALSLAEKTAG